ncbi:MAG: resuscitation-promoting factor RpfC [Solirubrobacterales bacterium]|jgi:septal ring factor EnvC (AmiA/AmiB activator)|nr:resuscitation-promoting factor RpfC [Solirubrobacterales bacterium]
MGRTDRHTPARARKTIAALLAALLLAVGAAQALGAQSIDGLNLQIAGAKDQAQALAAQIDDATAQLAAAQQQAIVAAEREAQLNSVLERGRERERRLEAEVARTREELGAARRQLHRGLNALSNRLVDIYRGGMPDATALLLESDGYDDLTTRAEYLKRVEQADASLVSRVRSLRDEVSKRLNAVEEAQQRAEDFNAQIEAARDEIAAVRAEAESRASQLAALRSQRQAAVESLQAQVGRWTDQVQRLERISAAQAQSEVSAWFGDWAIPEAIVMCESGGNFGAVNPSSGAGGAYQILPSTWELYGGQGLPQDASPSEQSDIAAQIWADSGSAAWECAG